MSLNRRTLLKLTSGSLIGIPIAGCISNPSERLGELQLSKSENFFTLSQQTKGELKKIQLKLTYESITTNDVGTLKTFTESDLNKEENKYTKQISKEKIFKELPKGKPVKVYLESSLQDSDFTKVENINSRYYMIRYVADDIEHHVDTDMIINSIDENGISKNKLHKWESEEKIHFKIFFNILYPELESVGGVGHGIGLEDRNHFEFIPFIFDLSISKDKKERFDDLRENREITWKDFHKEVDVNSNTIKYYEQDMIKDFANQIKAQLNHYDREFSGIEDVTLVLKIWESLLNYDYGALKSSDLHLKYFSQILYSGTSICQGTTFSIASILHQLGYDVGMQVIVDKRGEYPEAGFHIESTAELDNETVEDRRDLPGFSGPDISLDDIPEEKIKNHYITYPNQNIGENKSERYKTDDEGNFIEPPVEVERVQMEYLEADS